MKDEEIIRRLQEAARAGAPPAQVAHILDEIAPEGLQQSSLTMFLKQAFPRLPLRTLLEAGAWRAVSDGGISDEDFNQLLSPYLGDPGHR